MGLRSGAAVGGRSGVDIGAMMAELALAPGYRDDHERDHDMTAGAGSARYSADSRAPEITVVTSLVVAVLIVASALSIAWQRHGLTASAVPLPGWGRFQASCEAGPSPGQGNTPQECVCWEANLRAEAIRPAHAVDALDAAQVRGGEANTVPEKLGFGPIGWAMGGCWLYGGPGAQGVHQQGGADQAVWPGV
jgi:hypothetical protein